ncbi:MAG: ribosome hibernation promotion factor [Deltaproteobacteria bacterium]
MIQLSVTARHINDRARAEELKKYAAKKIKRLERLIEPSRNPSEIRLVLSVEKFRNFAELFLECGSIKATSSSETDDMQTAIDRTVDAAVKQLKKQTDKWVKTKRRSLRSKGEAAHPGGAPANHSDGQRAGAIKMEKLPPKPMSIAEAVLQLKVSGGGFLAFHNSETGEVNVLYKSEENNLGLVTP